MMIELLGRVHKGQRNCLNPYSNGMMIELKLKGSESKTEKTS